MNRKVLVVSHERSGTHFLINALAQNFGFLPNQIDIDGRQRVNWANPAESAAWFAQFRGRPIANVFKSHHDAAFFRPLLGSLADEFRIFYIHRDGRDVMTSFWRYLHQVAPGWGPRAETVGAFLRTYPTGGIVQYQSRYHLTMLERWVAHVADWHDLRSQVHLIGYEMLHLRFEETMEDVAHYLHWDPPPSYVRPALTAPSSVPWRGETGNWQHYFTNADTAYFNRTAAGTMRKLGYGVGD